MIWTCVHNTKTVNNGYYYYLIIILITRKDNGREKTEQNVEYKPDNNIIIINIIFLMTMEGDYSYRVTLLPYVNVCHGMVCKTSSGRS